MDRIATFKSFIARSPTDPFPRYGLAMDYASAGDHGHRHVEQHPVEF